LTFSPRAIQSAQPPFGNTPWFAISIVPRSVGIISFIFFRFSIVPRSIGIVSFIFFSIVYEHLVINGIDPTYAVWFRHGEEFSEMDAIEEMETYGAYNLFRATNLDNDGDAAKVLLNQAPRIYHQVDSHGRFNEEETLQIPITGGTTLNRKFN
ncbi:hypothetical protein PanWU01x14_156780, partial [Parasponia andersonii]